MVMAMEVVKASALLSLNLIRPAWSRLLHPADSAFCRKNFAGREATEPDSDQSFAAIGGVSWKPIVEVVSLATPKDFEGLEATPVFGGCGTHTQWGLRHSSLP